MFRNGAEMIPNRALQKYCLNRKILNFLYLEIASIRSLYKILNLNFPVVRCFLGLKWVCWTLNLGSKDC